MEGRGIQWTQKEVHLNKSELPVKEANSVVQQMCTVCLISVSTSAAAAAARLWTFCPLINEGAKSLLSLYRVVQLSQLAPDSQLVKQQPTNKQQNSDTEEKTGTHRKRVETKLQMTHYHIRSETPHRHRDTEDQFVRPSLQKERKEIAMSQGNRKQKEGERKREQ